MKKGLSPIISTVILIGIVIALAVIVLLFMRSQIKDIIEKEILGVKKSIDKFCVETNFEASVSGDQIVIVNKGNVPIYQVNVERIKGGESKVDNYVIELDAGGTYPSEASDMPIIFESGDEKAVIVPVLLGKAGKNLQTYTCPDSVAYELDLQ